MKVKKGQLFELDISGIAFGGKGLAKINGLTVFVDKAVPLDTVVARIVKRKKQYAEQIISKFLSQYKLQPINKQIQLAQKVSIKRPLYIIIKQRLLGLLNK